MSMMISYSQNGEDVILERIFADKKLGFYIDIGASHPENLSVTKHFYDKGWRGINIDPLKNCMDTFVQSRSRDINLNIAIDAEAGLLDFYEITDYPELSTFSPQAANILSKSGYKVECYPVERITGSELFEKYVHGPVDFLKIDVEGRELSVIKSIDFKLYRPKVLVIEATEPHHPFPGWSNFGLITKFQEWETQLLDSHYIFAYFDGLNRFYVSEECKEILIFFQVGLCLWDNFILYPQSSEISELRLNCLDARSQVEELTKLVEESEIDREARGEQIELLTKMLKHREDHNLARGEQIKSLNLLLQESEADREARWIQISELTSVVKQNEQHIKSLILQIEAFKNQNSELLNQNSELLNQNSELLNQNSELLNQNEIKQKEMEFLVIELLKLFNRTIIKSVIRLKSWPELNNLFYWVKGN